MPEPSRGTEAAIAHAAVNGSPLARARHGLDACVHCGFCLQACPTYLALEDENDSPRGRILLMRSVVDGTLDAQDSAVQTHISRCLGCRACETACPSGVPYGELLEATRATLLEKRPLPIAARLILAVFANPALLWIAMSVARVLRVSGIARALSRLPGRAGLGMAMIAATAPRARPSSLLRSAGIASSVSGTSTPGNRPSRGRVAILRGCVMHGLLSHTNRAAARMLERVGYDVAPAPGQVCCGALHAHAGDLAGARALARTNVTAFKAAGFPSLASTAAGCGAMLESYGHLLADDVAYAPNAARVAAAACDISELLAPALDGATRPHGDARVRGSATARSLRVAYDSPCHLLHAQRVADPPLAMLRATPGIELVPLDDADQCCGAAGIYNLLEPTVSNTVLAPKLAHITASRADCVATGNPGCLMQIGAGLRRAGSRTQVVHPVDLLDSAYG